MTCVRTEPLADQDDASQGALVSTPADVGALIRSTRLRRRLSQAELAQASGVSRAWLIKVEEGHPGAELGRVLTVLRALGLQTSARDHVTQFEADDDLMRQILGETP